MVPSFIILFKSHKKKKKKEEVRINQRRTVEFFSDFLVESVSVYPLLRILELGWKDTPHCELSLLMTNLVASLCERLEYTMKTLVVSLQLPKYFIKVPDQSLI